MSYVETSAKDGTQVDECFIELARKIVIAKQGVERSKQNNTVDLTEKPAKKTNKLRCYI